MSSPIEKELANFRQLAKSLCKNQQDFCNTKLIESCEIANANLKKWEKDGHDLISQLWDPPAHLRLPGVPRTTNAIADIFPKFSIHVNLSGPGSPPAEPKEPGQVVEKVPNPTGNGDNENVDVEDAPVKKSDGLASGKGERLSGSSGSTVFHTPESIQHNAGGVSPTKSGEIPENEPLEDVHSNSHTGSEHSNVEDVVGNRKSSTPSSKRKSSDGKIEERVLFSDETHSVEDKEEAMLDDSDSADLMAPSTQEDDDAQFQTAEDTMDLSEKEEPDSNRVSSTHSSPVAEDEKESPVAGEEKELSVAKYEKESPVLEEKKGFPVAENEKESPIAEEEKESPVIEKEKKSPVGLEKPPSRITSSSLDEVNKDQPVDEWKAADINRGHDRKRSREEDPVSPLPSKETKRDVGMSIDEQQNPGKRRSSPSRKKSVSFKVSPSFSVGRDGTISFDAINALQKIGTDSATSVPKTPSESRVSPRIGPVIAKSTASSSTHRAGRSHMRGALKFSSKRSSLLAHTPGALPPLPPSSKEASRPAARGQESDVNRFASISEGASSFEGDIQSSSEPILDKENDGNSENLLRESRETDKEKSPISSKGMSRSKQLNENEPRQTCDPKQSHLTGILRDAFLDRQHSGNFSTPQLDLNNVAPKTEMIPTRTISHLQSAGPKSEARRQIERVRAERIAARGRHLSSAQHSNDHNLNLSSLRADSGRGIIGVAANTASNELSSKDLTESMSQKEVGEGDLGSCSAEESKILRPKLQEEPMSPSANHDHIMPKTSDHRASVEIISKKNPVGTNIASVLQSPRQEGYRHSGRQEPVIGGVEYEVKKRVGDSEDDTLGSNPVAKSKFSRLKLREKPLDDSINLNRRASKISDQGESVSITIKKSSGGTDIAGVAQNPQHEFQHHDEDKIEPLVPINNHQKRNNIEEDGTEAQREINSEKSLEGPSSGLLNLVTSVTSFLPSASSLLGIRAQEEQEEEEEDSEAVLRRQKLDAERREAEVQARREAMRFTKQKEMEEKQRRAEANRRLRAEEDRVREEERKKKEERRLRKKQEEEEGRRRKKMEEDKKREQRRKQVLLHKRKIEKERENESKRQKREKVVGAVGKNNLKTNKLGAGVGSDSSQIGGWEHGSPSDSLPPTMNRTPKGSRRPLQVSGPSNYEMTPANETFFEESDEEKERRRGKLVPKWAEADKVLTSVKDQADPDDLFASGPMCDLSEVFGDQRKYRTRSSSGNWMQDRLTAQERLAYKKATRDLDNS